MHLPSKRFILMDTLGMKRIIALENTAFKKSTIEITRLLISIFWGNENEVTEKNLHVLKAS